MTEANTMADEKTQGEPPKQRLFREFLTWQQTALSATERADCNELMVALLTGYVGADQLAEAMRQAKRNYPPDR